MGRYYYCFACKTLFKSGSNICRRCGRGAGRARRKLFKSSPVVDTYQIYVGNKLVCNQRVNKKVD